MFGESCSCLFVFTSCDSHRTTITHLLISWSSPTAQFYSTHSSHIINTARTVPFPFTALDSETSTGSGNLSKDSNKNGDLVRPEKGKTPLNDATNSQARSQIQKEDRKRPIPSQFDASVKPKDQPFQTSWSTVFYSSTDPVEVGTSSNSLSSRLTRRGCYVCRLSPTCGITALAINKREASDCSVVFFSPLTDTGLSSPLYPPKKRDKSGRY